MNDTVLDAAGNEITPGCRCLYPMRQKSKMWMAAIKVESIQEIDGVLTIIGFNDTGRRTHTKNIQNCVVVG